MVPSADSPAMAAAISDLAADSSRRQRLGANGRQWVEGRSLKTLGEESAQFLAEVIGA